MLAQDIASLKSIPPGIRADTVAIYSTGLTKLGGWFPTSSISLAFPLLFRVFTCFRFCFPFPLASNFIAVLGYNPFHFAFNFLVFPLRLNHLFVSSPHASFQMRSFAALASTFQFYATFRAVSTHLQSHQSFALYPSVAFPFIFNRSFLVRKPYRFPGSRLEFHGGLRRASSFIAVF